MGDSRPPEAAPLDLVNSYARRRGDRVEVVLAQPEGALAVDGATVILRSGGERRRSTGALVDDPRGRRLVASFPKDRLDDGQWAVVVRHDGTRTPAGVRVLIQGDRPVVLLWGARANKPQVEV